MHDACNALDRVREQKAEDLFWEGVEPGQAAGLVDRARSRVVSFRMSMTAVLEKEASLRKLINGCLDELDVLDDEVREAYAREARREEEYVVEREIFSVRNHPMTMPWSRETESEKHFRKAMLVAMLAVFLTGTLIALLKVPQPVRPALVVIPDRLVSMLREEPHRAAPPRKKRSPRRNRKKRRLKKKKRHRRKTLSSRGRKNQQVHEKKRRARESWPSRRALKDWSMTVRPRARR